MKKHGRIGLAMHGRMTTKVAFCSPDKTFSEAEYKQQIKQSKYSVSNKRITNANKFVKRGYLIHASWKSATIL